jgi:hypothetical protein
MTTLWDVLLGAGTVTAKDLADAHRKVKESLESLDRAKSRGEVNDAEYRELLEYHTVASGNLLKASRALETGARIPHVALDGPRNLPGQIKAELRSIAARRAPGVTRAKGSQLAQLRAELAQMENQLERSKRAAEERARKQQPGRKLTVAQMRAELAAMERQHGARK